MRVKSLGNGGEVCSPWRFTYKLLAGAVLLGSSMALPQVGPKVDPEVHALAERRFRFESTWSKASPAHKDRLRAEVRRYRNVGLPALRHVDSPRLVRWTRILNGHSVSELPTDLEQWIARLELRLIPGWGSTSTLDGDPQLVVHVLAPSQPPAFPKSEAGSKLTLTWLGPAGERVLARSVSVQAKDFSRNGFELFLQAPGDHLGTWMLEPALVLPNQTWTGHPIEFVMRRQWPGFPDGAPDGSPWEAAISQWGKTGFRNMRWGGCSGLLDGELSNLRDLVMERSADGQCLTLRSKSAEGPELCKALVWVALPGGHLLESELLGERAAAWKALVDQGVTVMVSHAPLVLPGQTKGSASQRMAQETVELGDVPRILVVRGNQARGLGLGSKEVFQGFNALVLQGPRRTETVPTAPFEGAPTLFLFPSDPWESPQVPAGQKAVASMDPPAVMAMDLPRYLAENLELLTSKVGDGKPSAGEPR
ncbi:MAG: hypothetical protein P1V35_09590 [Planctomycetota bacterium]|nr:hypothetical protein [Planctomycetota bacterium]